MFQPGEEGNDGAGHMIREGVLDAAGPRVIGAYGLHVMSDRLPRGHFVSRAGTFMAGADEILVTVRGAGAHGSRPHTGKDPIPVACEMVLALQTLVTRKFDIFDPVVITVGAFHAGTASNIIPDDAAFHVTMRSFSRESRAKLLDAVVDLLNGLAAAYGMTRGHHLQGAVPADREPRARSRLPGGGRARGARRGALLPDRPTRTPAPRTSPGCWRRCRARTRSSARAPGTTSPSAPSNHSPLADFDDSVLGDGAALLAELADRRLARG